MTNPFNDTPHGRDGTDPEFETLTTQGFHSLSAADVDGDGKHEIVYGAATIDHDGDLLYSSFARSAGRQRQPGHDRPGSVTATPCTSPTSTPTAPVWRSSPCTRAATSAPYGMAMREADTGEVIFGAYSGRDTGRGMIGDVVPESRGLESWASLPGGSEALGLYSPTGQRISELDPRHQPEHPVGRRHDDPDRQRLGRRDADHRRLAARHGC